jgi:hypothetical protein
VKTALGLVFYLIVGLAFAQVVDDELLVIPELVKEDLADINIDAQYKEYDSVKGAFSISGYSSEVQYITSYIHLKKKDWQIRGGMRHENEFLANLQFKHRQSFVLGSFSPTWGNGLVLKRQSGNNRMKNPPHPSSFSPSGLGIDLQYKCWGLIALASQVERDVRLSEEMISFLPKTKQSYICTSTEQILAAGLYYRSDLIEAGSLYYYQLYDRAFSSSRADSLLQTVSTYLILNSTSNTLKAELAMHGKTPALKSEWCLQSGMFRNTWSYTRLLDYQRPAYASKAMLLNTLDNREEISVELQYKPLKALQFNFGTVINHRRGDINDPQWLSHSSFKATFKNSNLLIALKLKLIDREILTSIDSIYIHSKPLHLRFNLTADYNVDSNWRIECRAHYHQQEKAAALSNGSYWAQHIAYSSSGLNICGGFRVNSSANYKMLIYQNNDMGYEVLGHNNLQAEFELGYKWSLIEASMQIRQEVLNDKQTKLRFVITTVL